MTRVRRALVLIAMWLSSQLATVTLTPIVFWVSAAQRGRHDEAISELQKAVQLSAGSPTCTANLARAFAASGRKNEAVQLLGNLRKRSRAAIRMPRRLPRSVRRSATTIKR